MINCLIEDSGSYVNFINCETRQLIQINRAYLDALTVQAVVLKADIEDMLNYAIIFYLHQMGISVLPKRLNGEALANESFEEINHQLHFVKKLETELPILKPNEILEILSEE